MTEEKARRIQAAITSAATILLFILVAIMLYGMATIKGKEAKIQQLEAEIAELEQKNAQTRDSIDLWLNEWKITERANELGYLYKTDK